MTPEVGRDRDRGPEQDVGAVVVAGLADGVGGRRDPRDRRDGGENRPVEAGEARQEEAVLPDRRLDPHSGLRPDSSDINQRDGIVLRPTDEQRAVDPEPDRGRETEGTRR